MGDSKTLKRRGQGATRVYTRLREDILRLKLAPGEPLDETRLGKDFGLSRSPVREAIVRLASEGLVKTLPNKSTIVAPLNIAEFSSYIDALDLIQRITTRLAARLRTDEQLQNIKKRQEDFCVAMNDRDPLGMIERNHGFHVAISDASQNRYLSEFNSRLLDEGRRYLRLYFRSFNDILPSEFSDEHNQIIDAIEAQDEVLAERLAHEHSMQVRDRFLRYLSRTQTTGLSVLPPGDGNTQPDAAQVADAAAGGLVE
ncbi:MAG TPA: GntR family transcriptional regulator [Arenicellales bacterium]|nr:GntR family transcriptional regulator [Arenicellales bacterium]